MIIWAKRIGYGLLVLVFLFFAIGFFVRGSKEKVSYENPAPSASISAPADDEKEETLTLAQVQELIEKRDRDRDLAAEKAETARKAAEDKANEARNAKIAEDARLAEIDELKEKNAQLTTQVQAAIKALEEAKAAETAKAETAKAEAAKAAEVAKADPAPAGKALEPGVVGIKVWQVGDGEHRDFDEETVKYRKGPEKVHPHVEGEKERREVGVYPVLAADGNPLKVTGAPVDLKGAFPLSVKTKRGFEKYWFMN